MTENSMLEFKSIPAALILAMLAACSANDENGADVSGEPATVMPTQQADEPISILRPDIEQPQQPDIEEAPEDLEVVIGFPEGGAELDDAALLALQEMLESEQIALGGNIVLRGHSDAGGGSAVNLRASQDRADAIADWLKDKGIEEDRIQILAFGLQNPVAPNAMRDGEPDEGGRALNRRVEVEVLLPRPDPKPEAELDAADSAEASD